MTAPDPGSDPYLAPPVDAEQLALLRRYGQERPTTAGQVLFREGDGAYDFIVVLSGAVTVVDHDAGVERELATLGPSRFVGELGILTGERVFATAVVTEPGSVLVVPVDRLQQVIARDQGLADLIVQAVLRRRQWLLQLEPACGSLARGRHRMPGGCGSSRPAITCPTPGSTWTPTRLRAWCSPSWTQPG